MELAQRLKQARLEAGLSQRALCGDEITRNMLSQIENGSARPSMDTLRYLAARLGKSVSYFLEEEVVCSPNQTVMERARNGWAAGEYDQVMHILEEYRGPDAVFDREKHLLEHLAVLARAEQALREGRALYAGQMLEGTDIGPDDYCGASLNRRKMLLLAKIYPQRRREICASLESLDDELLLRARDALDRGEIKRSASLLDAAEDRENADWNFLRGEVYQAQKDYAAAAACYHRAEEAYPAQTAPYLERCYRELEDYKKAYFYACRQR